MDVWGFTFLIPQAGLISADRYATVLGLILLTWDRPTRTDRTSGSLGSREDHGFDQRQLLVHNLVYKLST